MQSAVRAVLALSVVLAPCAFAATQGADPAHVQAVQDLLAAMHAEKMLLGVAGASHYATEAQRQAVYARIDQVPPAEIDRRLALPLAPVISTETAREMARYYNTPYGKQVIYRKYNSGAQIMMPGMRTRVAPEELKERERPAYVQASKALADAQPAIDHEAFKLLQQIDKEKR